MSHRWRSMLGLILGLSGLWACSDDGHPALAGPPGAAGSGAQSGGGPLGGSGGAGGSTTEVGGAGGSGVPLEGFGIITGDCGVIAVAEIEAAAPYDFANVIDFDSLTYDYDELSPGGQEVYDDGNLGGSSIYSEVFSYEVLYRCELAELRKTEGEIEYQDPNGIKTDLLVEIDGHRLGVSVTRAYQYPPGEPFPVAGAFDLLEGKLADILVSSANVAPADAWQKQILHVLAYDDQHRDSLAQAYAQIDEATKADTIVLITVTDGNDEFIY